MTETSVDIAGAPCVNNLLAVLMPADKALLEPHLEAIDISRGDVLFDCGERVEFVVFPCNQAVVSLIVPMDPDHLVETASIGREGAVGGIVSRGFLPAFTRAVVHNSGPALRLSLLKLQAAKAESPTLRNLFARYADCLLSQVLQSVACNALHTIDQRSAKWLLSTRDRIGDDRLELTHEAFAAMLGVQRSYVSKVLGRFHRRGWIRISRGRVDILEAAKLKEATCECYNRVTQHFDHVLQGVYPETGALDPATDPASAAVD